MRRAKIRAQTWRSALTAGACVLASAVGGCAGGSGGATYVDVDYGYGVYYGSAWQAGYYGGGPVYVGPPAYPPPGAIGGRPPGSVGGAPPHVSNMPARPLPPPMGRGGGGRRR